MSGARKSFKTGKGTELPLLTLKGKEYLQVAHRLVWFREDHPTGVIRTIMKERQGEGKDEYAVFQAEIHVMTERGPMLVATAHKKETRGGFDDFIEKAETGSIGRALALMGYGTQFAADELDEGNRLADAPLPTVATNAAADAEGGIETTVAPKRSSFRKNVTGASSATAGDDI
jgi:hypothetical protein